MLKTTVIQMVSNPTHIFPKHNENDYSSHIIYFAFLSTLRAILETKYRINIEVYKLTQYIFDIPLFHSVSFMFSPDPRPVEDEQINARIATLIARFPFLNMSTESEVHGETG